MSTPTVNLELLAAAISGEAINQSAIAKVEVEVANYASAKMLDEGSSHATAVLYGSSMVSLLSEQVKQMIMDNVKKHGATISDEVFAKSYHNILKSMLDQHFEEMTVRKANKAIADKEAKQGITRKM